MPSSDNGLIKRLKTIGKKYATNITRDANKNLGKFKKLILVKSESKANGNVVEIVSTGISPKGVARAYEFGSGVHSRSSKKSRHQISAKGKILIKPVRKKILAFHWDVASTFEMERGRPGVFIFGRDGKVLLSSVKHPGVQAANAGKGYLAPAISKNRKPMKAEIAKEVGEEARAVLRRAFSKK